MKFDPRKLRYGKEGTPVLSAIEIEQIANEVLETHCHGVLQKPQQTPVAEILEALKARTQLKVVFDELGFVNDAKILGKVNFRQNLLSLDASLLAQREIQFRFTAAHEIGHWIIHRWNWKNWTLEGTQNEPKVSPVEILEDNEDTLCRLDHRTPRDWLEYQANVFASNLVAPRATFQTALVAVQHEIGILKNLGTVYVSNNARHLTDYHATLAALGGIYGISKTSSRVRLQTLDLLIGEFPKRASEALSTVLPRGGRNK
jgi:Zn-dependent peptidase ImmA (M78 family)